MARNAGRKKSRNSVVQEPVNENIEQEFVEEKDEQETVVIETSETEAGESVVDKALDEEIAIDLKEEESAIEPADTSVTGVSEGSGEAVHEFEEKPTEEYEMKLTIHERKIISIPIWAKRVVVENIGGGDLYVDANAITFKSNALVPIGERREFTGVSSLFVSTASRPTFRVSIYK